MEKKRSVQAGEVNLEAHREVRSSGVVLVSPETVGSRSIWMGIGFLAPEEEMPTGAHDSEEALFVVRGSGVLSADGQEIGMKPGTAVYIPENVEHSIRNTGIEEMIFIVSETKTPSVESKGNFTGELCLNCE